MLLFTIEAKGNKILFYIESNLPSSQKCNHLNRSSSIISSLSNFTMIHLKKKTKKTFKNTESLVYSIQTKDLYDDMLKDQDLFDFAFLAKISNWEMKDELNGLKICWFACEDV